MRATLPLTRLRGSVAWGPRRFGHPYPDARHTVLRARQRTAAQAAGRARPLQRSDDRPDRPRDADGRRPAAGRRRTWNRGVPGASADVARHRAVRRPLRDGRRRARARRAPRCRPAGRRGAAPLQRRAPGADPGAAAARDGAGGDRGAAGRDERDRRHPRPHAPQVRRARRGCRLDRVDQLDGRLVVPPGERHRHRRLARRRLRVRAGVRAALGERPRRPLRARRPAPGRGRHDQRPRMVLPRATGRRSRTGSRSTSGRRVPGSGSRRPCSPPARSWRRSSRS